VTKILGERRYQIMRKTISIAIALLVTLGMVLGTAPVLAETVDTGVNVTEGTGNPPIIKCKWEQDLTPTLEDGDPGHSTPGSQFLPPCEYQGKKAVQYWAVVTDPEGVNTIETVDACVYHPAGPPECGSFKYQKIMTKVDKWTVGIPAYEAARDAGLVHYQTGIDDAEVMYELDKCTAHVWMVEEVLDYHQPAGEYEVHINACDSYNKWASSASTDLWNKFLYVAVPCFEVDFNRVDYGDVVACSEKWIAGDTIMQSPVAAAPSPNPATVRNIGNTNIKLTVHQDHMGFGHSDITGTTYQGSTPPAPGESNWNVVFDARLGSNPANGMYYDPCVTVTLPNPLPLCNTEELDFSIHVVKAGEGGKSGYMDLGCVISPFEGACD
jgi:hypothetical protein